MTTLPLSTSTTGKRWLRLLISLVIVGSALGGCSAMLAQNPSSPVGAPAIDCGMSPTVRTLAVTSSPTVPSPRVLHQHKSKFQEIHISRVQ